MKKLSNSILKWHLPIIILLGVIIISCSSDDDPVNLPEFTGNSEEYSLFSKSLQGVNGQATFAERDDGVTVITIELNGTPAGGDHPSHIHTNTAAEGGGIAIDLTNIDGSTGMSVTEVSSETYNDLINFNGYINVHLSPSDLGTLIAQGDIGQNELTGISVEYPLNSKSDPNINGTATFAQRENGATLITVQLEGTSEGGDHPAHIHVNDAATGGGIAISLSNVNGATGTGATSATMLNDGTAMTYEDLIVFNGYINVHLSDMDLATLIAQGDIGANAD